MWSDALDFARYQFKYGGREKDGSTTHDHIQAAQANPFAAALSTPLVEEIIEEPPILPEFAMYAWSYFLRLNKTRQLGGMGGFCAITHQEMLAFFTLEQDWPQPYEVELIRQFDSIALEHYAEQQKRDMDYGKSK